MVIGGGGGQGARISNLVSRNVKAGFCVGLGGGKVCFTHTTTRACLVMDWVGRCYSLGVRWPRQGGGQV